MRDSLHKNRATLIFDPVQDPIISYSKTPGPLVLLEQLNTNRSWIVADRGEAKVNCQLDRHRKALHRLTYSWSASYLIPGRLSDFLRIFMQGNPLWLWLFFSYELHLPSILERRRIWQNYPTKMQP